MILVTREEEKLEDRYFAYAMKDEKDPMGLFERLQQQMEDHLDPNNREDVIEEHSKRDWYRTT